MTIRDMPTNLVIVSPFYQPAPGGAAQYYSSLAAQLLKDRTVDTITIFTEAYPEFPKVERTLNSRLTIRRLFPHRAGDVDMSRWVIALYLFQQLQLLTLPFRISRSRTVVLVHGYFHNKPGLAPVMALLLRLLRGANSRLIVDLRDCLLPTWAFPTLYPYDAIICCSAAVRELVASDPRLASKAHGIPIPFELDRPSGKEVDEVLLRYGLDREAYVYSGNGVQQGKNVEEVLSMVESLRHRGRDVKLVIAGRRRDWTDRYEAAQDADVLQYVGAVGHRDSLCLAAGSALVPIITPTAEGMPRLALEALALGVPAMLPPNVLEFRNCCPDQIADSIAVDDLVVLAERLMGGVNTDYDLAVHGYERTAAQYATLFRAG